MIGEWVHSTGRKREPSATQSTTNPTCTDLAFIPNLHGARLASNRQASRQPYMPAKDKTYPTEITHLHGVPYRTNSDNTIRAYSEQFSINSVAAPRGDCYKGKKWRNIGRTQHLWLFLDVKFVNTLQRNTKCFPCLSKGLTFDHLSIYRKRTDLQSIMFHDQLFL